MTARAQGEFDGGRRAGPEAPVPASVPTSVRKAALLLHTVGPRDRAWLVERLTESDRKAVRPLLAELGTLGIPADRGLVEEVVAGARGTSTPPDVEHGSVSEEAIADAVAAGLLNPGLVALLERAEPARLAAILRHEPPGLVAKLLALRPWPWSGELLGRLRPSMARDVEEAASRRQAARSPGGPPDGSGAATPLLANRLLAILTVRLLGEAPNREPVIDRALGESRSGGAARAGGASSLLPGALARLFRRREGT